MRTRKEIKHSLKRVGFCAAAAAAAALAAICQARADDRPAPAQTKAYTLFLGTDLSLTTKDGTFPVWDISDGSWVIKVKGEAVHAEANEGPAQLKMRTGLRLTEASAVVANLKSRPEYTPANDPYTKFTKATNKAASDYAQSQFAANYGAALMYHVDALTGAEANPSQLMSVSPTSDSSTAAQRSMADAGGYVVSANMAGGATPGLVVATGGNPDTEAYDALDISFDVSAPKPLNRPYVVIICRYHERGAPAGAYRDWIHARPLNVIDSKPTHIHFLAGGFTPGYELKSFELHLYNMGSEIATNLSPRRVEYTLDEAYGYYMKAYLRSHRNATVQAAAVMGQPPADLSSRIAQGQVAKELFVKVSRDGMGTSAFLDEACTRKVEDPYVASVIGSIRFTPALENGAPVEGVAALRLDHLAI